MKNIIKIALATLVMLSMSTVTLNADVKKGQKLYLKKLKSVCHLNGAKMAVKHSQSEWKGLNESGKLANELKNLCPKATESALKDKYLQHYFDFFFEYANDSGNVPSC